MGVGAGGECQSNPHCKRPQLFKNHKAKLTQVLWQLNCYITSPCTFLIKRLEGPNYEKPQLKKKVIWLTPYFENPQLVCAKFLFNRQEKKKKHSDIDCQVDLKPQKKKEIISVHSSGPHFYQDVT